MATNAKSKNAPKSKAAKAKPKAQKAATRKYANASAAQRPAEPVLIRKAPKGFKANPEGRVLVPESHALVEPGKINQGIEKAQGAIKDLLKAFSDTLTEDYAIKEIELTVSFSADGKFLGFGVGGATSISVTIGPVGR